MPQLFHFRHTGRQCRRLRYHWQSYQLPTPLGFGLTDLGVVGLFLQFEIDIALHSKEPADVTFGFNFTVPHGAFIEIDVADLKKSTIQGFQPSEGFMVDALPVHANLSGPDFSLSAAFKTSLLFGFSFLHDDVYANAGAFLELPKLVIKERQLDGCPAVSTDGKAIKIVPEVQVNVGVGLQAGLEPAGNGLSEQRSRTLASLDHLLPTTCVAESAPVTLSLGTISTSVTASPSSATESSTPSISYGTSTTTTDVVYMTVTTTKGEKAVATATDVAYTTVYTTLVTTTSC